MVEYVLRGDPRRRYVITSEAGRGADGVVYNARINGHQRVAFKVFRDVSRERLAQMQREIELRRGLVGIRGIPRYLTHGITTDGKLALVHEPAHGRSLEDIVSVSGIGGMRTEAEARQFLVNALTTLNEFHRRGIVHGDVVPSNLVVRTDGGVTFSSLGTVSDQARTYNDDGGNPSFMAPEQLEGSPSYASDIFSLGMSVGAVVLRENPDISFAQKRDLNRPDFDSSRADKRYSPEFLGIIQKMTAKRADQRYQSVGEVVADLTRDPQQERQRWRAFGGVAALGIGCVSLLSMGLAALGLGYYGLFSDAAVERVTRNGIAQGKTETYVIDDKFPASATLSSTGNKALANEIIGDHLYLEGEDPTQNYVHARSSYAQYALLAGKIEGNISCSQDAVYTCTWRNDEMRDDVCTTGKQLSMNDERVPPLLEWSRACSEEDEWSVDAPTFVRYVKHAANPEQREVERSLSVLDEGDWFVFTVTRDVANGSYGHLLEQEGTPREQAIIRAIAGDHMFKQRRIHEAGDLYRQAHELDPSWYTTYSLLAVDTVSGTKAVSGRNVYAPRTVTWQSEDHRGGVEAQTNALLTTVRGDSNREAAVLELDAIAKERVFRWSIRGKPLRTQIGRDVLYKLQYSEERVPLFTWTVN